MQARYVLRRDEEGWTVLDTATQSPAIVNDTPMVHMPEDLAQEVASLLNEIAADQEWKTLQ